MQPDYSRQLVPAKIAAARVGYSADYVARLAREGSIIAEQKGRQWFVDVESLKLFSLQREAEQRQRQTELREARLSEIARTAVLSHTEQIESRELHNRTLATALAAVCFMLVAFFGTVTNLAYSEKLSGESLTAGLSEIFSSLQERFGFSLAFTNDRTISENTGDIANGLIVMPTPTPSETVREIQNVFSDEVAVTFDTQTTGVITPVFEDRSEATSFQFVLVPIEQASTSVPTP